MRHIQKYLLFILLLAVAVACTPSATNSEPTTAAPTTASLPEAEKPIMIRIHNNSDQNFDSVEVQFPTQSEQYGSLAADSSSDYHAISEAYRYAYVKVTIGGEEFVLQPIDYVGESLLDPGEYTYVLDLKRDLSLELVEGNVVIERPTETAVPATEAPTVDLNGTKWMLVAYGAADRPEAVLPETEITAEFHDGQLTGSAGCNQYSSSYEQNGSELTTGAVASTRIGCEPPINEQEMRVLQGLETAVSFEISNDTLTIQHENGVLVFVAAAADQPETADDTPETILILSPGPGSAVTSPVIITGESDYAFEGTLAVEITALEAETAVPTGNGFAMLNVSEIGQRGPYSGEVNFESPTAPTPGRISVFMISARDGHIEHLASVPVTLLPAGATPDIKTADLHPEAIAIHSPQRLTTLTDGSVHVTAWKRCECRCGPRPKRR
jgi:heat shock protein HslJ